MNSNKKTARVAGALYLLMSLAFMFSLGYLPGRFLIEGDPAATMNAIRGAEWVFRVGIDVGMFACVLYALQVFVVYKLLNPVSKNAAVVFVAMSLAHLPLFFAGHIDELNLLSLLNRSQHGTAFGSEQLQAQVSLLVDSYNSSLHLNMLFMGLWLLPFGYLVYKSNILPKTLGVLLILNSIPYLFSFFKLTLAPDLQSPEFVKYLTTPLLVGEFATCLWLLIMGAKEWDTQKKVSDESSFRSS